MAKTIIQQILAAHLMEGELVAGSPISIKIDQTLCQDATGTMAFLELEAMNVDRVKTEVSVQYIDHNTNQMGPENANDHLYLQSVCAAKGVRYSRPGNGICHQVHLERFGIPGKTLLGSDSHTPTGGGIGMVAIGAGGLDVARAMAGIPFKLTCPKIIGIKLTGKLREWVSAKDVILKVLSILSSKGNVGTAVEYFGDGVATLSVPERATITNMGAELGVTTSVFPSDDETRRFLEAEGRGAEWKPLVAEEGAQYDRVIEIALDELVPLAACPSNPANVKTVAEVAGLPCSQVLVGSCTNSSLKDMQLVASMLKGRTVSPAVSLAIAPGSKQVLRMLAEDGSLAIMLAAGCRILESACGPCIGQGFSPASGTISVRTNNRNFLNRTGTKDDQCYLVSPATAVATALTGVLTDPAALAKDLDMHEPAWKMPEHFVVDDRMIIVPPADGSQVEIIRKETIGEPPHCTALPDTLEGEAVIAVGDRITTDHIMPAGANLKLRSNIPRYAKVVFDCFTEAGKPSFADRASALRDAGKAGFIVAGESYGQGSSREHAAICPMYLGVKAVLAISIERIHAANLVNFGILPLYFQKREDYESIKQGEKITIAGIRGQLAAGDDVHAFIGGKEIVLKCNLTAADRAVVLKGGLLAAE